MDRNRSFPARPPRSLRRQQFWVLGGTALAVGLLLAAGLGLADVVLFYQVQSTVGGTSSPFKFVNGGNYAAAHTQGLVTATYPNAQQVSVSESISGANGAYGSYVLDVLELQPTVTGAASWHYHVDVTRALVATGVNAAYVFYCTTAPTTVPDTGVPLASGTDANGNPWAIFAPTCAGTQVSLPLTALGTGTTIAISGTTSGTSLIFLSFGLAITNTGATTTTSALLTAVAISP
jgi:hypothetical protein